MEHFGQVPILIGMILLLQILLIDLRPTDTFIMMRTKSVTLRLLDSYSNHWAKPPPGNMLLERSI